MQLENTVLEVARQRLIELESLSKDFEQISDVVTRFSELTGLTELGQLADSGLSEKAIKELETIDNAALKIMSDFSNDPKSKSGSQSTSGGGRPVGR